jgi:pSer/pThr/pTyr-binding forkhead associated (FHA) protein
VNDDFFVSPKHLRLASREALVWLSDLGSTNGVEVNGTADQRSCRAARQRRDYDRTG